MNKKNLLKKVIIKPYINGDDMGIAVEVPEQLTLIGGGYYLSCYYQKKKMVRYVRFIPYKYFDLDKERKIILKFICDKKIVAEEQEVYPLIVE